MKKILFILNIILLITWMGVIFNFSNDPSEVSSSKSNRLIIKTIELVKQEKLPEDKKEIVLKKFTKLIRKTAHMFLYFILGILSFFLLHQIYGLKPITIIYTIIFCFIYACTDEFHQLFIPGRSSEFTDTLIDTFGCCISQIIPIIKLLFNHKKSI